MRRRVPYERICWTWLTLRNRTWPSTSTPSLQVQHCQSLSCFRHPSQHEKLEEMNGISHIHTADQYSWHSILCLISFCSYLCDCQLQSMTQFRPKMIFLSCFSEYLYIFKSLYKYLRCRLTFYLIFLSQFSCFSHKLT